jgi:hypothetical protein
MTEPLAKSTLANCLGIGLVSMATVLIELVLTRLFSASSGYHFAFMIVSMAMFGLTAGALHIFACPPDDEAGLFRKLSLTAALFALSLPIVYLAQGRANDAMRAIGPFLWLAITFLLYSIPFFFSGSCISLCLTRFRQVGKMYAADLVGAALSCPLIILGLTYSGLQTIIAFAGLLAILACFCFAGGMREIGRKELISATGAFLLCAGLNFMPEHVSLADLFGKIEYIKWSPVSRIIASDYQGAAVTWAKIKSAVPPLAVPQKGIYIDFSAFTVMTTGKATAAQLEPIQHDITAIANRIRPGKKLFVIGVGGGRDILTGLLYGQKQIDGLEVNPAIVAMLKEKYADFNGHLVDKPGVSIINDEARSWLARSQNKYDIIQCSLVDTWSASTSGAFMLTENALYTKEAFELFLKRVNADGMLCFLRWGDVRNPNEILRMLFLAKSALASMQISDIGSHIVLMQAPFRTAGSEHNIGAMLFSPTAFSQSDIQALAKIAQEEGYERLWLPGLAEVEPFKSAITSAQTDPGMPTDNCPFFFTPIKPTKAGEKASEPGMDLLKFTFALSLLLVLVTIIFPTWVRTQRKDQLTLGSVLHGIRSSLFFFCLGMAFMMIEVAQLQRLTILLGNPTYSLSSVLFALLLSSACGSYVAQYCLEKTAQPKTLLAFALSSAALLTILSAWIFSSGLPALEAQQLAARICFAVMLVSLPGFFMGWGFPVGMTYFTEQATTSGAWYWAINGATSVLSSVAAAMISLIWGIKATLVTGALAYLLALVSLI